MPPNARAPVQEVLDNPRYEVLRRIVADNTYSFWWSCCVLAAEIGGFILVHLSQQMFCRQDTKFFEMSPERVAQLREARPPLPGLGRRAEELGRAVDVLHPRPA